jgi:hypothetical protein
MDVLERSDGSCHGRNVYTMLCSGCVVVSIVYYAILHLPVSIIYCCEAAHEYKPKFNMASTICLKHRGKLH